MEPKSMTNERICLNIAYKNAKFHGYEIGWVLEMSQLGKKSEFWAKMLHLGIFGGILGGHYIHLVC
jgi:hypothetical protein